MQDTVSIFEKFEIQYRNYPAAVKAAAKAYVADKSGDNARAADQACAAHSVDKSEFWLCWNILGDETRAHLDQTTTSSVCGMQAPELLYYYRPLRRYPQVYKCAGHGAENPQHRAFYEPYFGSHDKDLVYLPGCIVSPYKGDRADAAKLEANI